MRKPTYRLTVSSDQAREIDKAVELLLRLKLGQYDVIPYNVMDIGADDFCVRRDLAARHLTSLSNAFAPYSTDDEWHMLYDLHQVIRKAIHDAEHPHTKGVDSYPVMPSGYGDLAEMEVVRK